MPSYAYPTLQQSSFPHSTLDTSSLAQDNMQNITPTYNSSLDGGGGEGDEKYERTLADTLWIYLSPFIFTIGICGNVLILLVMRRRRMSGTTTSVYLRSMAVFDICVLIVGIIPEWLEASGILVFKEISPVTCKIEKFSFYTFADTSIWILVVFTIDRFIALVLPFTKLDICLPTRAKYNCFAVFLVMCTKNCHVFWTRGPQYEIIGNITELTKMCGRPTPEFAHFEKYIRPWIAFTIVNALPFCILLICNIFIIKVLLQVKSTHNQFSSVNSLTSDRALFQMTAMCLSASFCFLICITPSIVLLIGRPYWAPADTTNKAYDIAKAINNQLVYINHSINFFLYCISGQRFRQSLQAVCRCILRRDSNNESFDSRFMYTQRITTPRSSPFTRTRSFDISPRYKRVNVHLIDTDGLKNGKRHSPLLIPHDCDSVNSHESRM